MGSHYMRGIPMREKLIAKTVTDDDGHWVWQAYLNEDGYGRIYQHGTMRGAHRVAYEEFIGPIPEGMDVHHVCEVRSCINPEHLEAVTHRRNTLLSDRNPAAINARKSHCPQGHPYDDENTIQKGNRRFCKTCRIERNASRSRPAGSVGA